MPLNTNKGTSTQAKWAREKCPGNTFKVGATSQFEHSVVVALVTRSRLKPLSGVHNAQTSKRWPQNEDNHVLAPTFPSPCASRGRTHGPCGPWLERISFLFGPACRLKLQRRRGRVWLAGMYVSIERTLYPNSHADWPYCHAHTIQASVSRGGCTRAPDGRIVNAPAFVIALLLGARHIQDDQIPPRPPLGKACAGCGASIICAFPTTSLLHAGRDIKANFHFSRAV